MFWYQTFWSLTFCNLTFCKPDVLKPGVLKPDVLKPDVLKPDVLWVYCTFYIYPGALPGARRDKLCWIDQIPTAGDAEQVPVLGKIGIYFAWLTFNKKVVIALAVAYVFQTKPLPLCLLTIQRVSLSPVLLHPLSFRRPNPTPHLQRLCCSPLLLHPLTFSGPNPTAYFQRLCLSPLL